MFFKKVFFLFLVILFVIPLPIMAVTREEYNEAVANVAISAATTYADEFVYTYKWGGSPSKPTNKMPTLLDWLEKAKKGIKITSGYLYASTSANAGIQGSFSNKFPVYCGSFVALITYHVSGGVTIYSPDYEEINPKNVKHGDLVHFDNHIAIFVGDENDVINKNWKVAEASSKIQVRVRPGDVDYGLRIKDSSLTKLDYNTVMASYDFHDRLDDYAPIIMTVNEIENTNRIKIRATDYKHYDLVEKSDILEPESNGIVAYQLTKTSTVPTTDWKQITKADVLEKEIEVDGNGIYYVHVKDVGGNVTTKMVNLTKIVIDKELPTLGEFSYEGMENSIKIKITGARDNIGIKEYRYYLDNEIITNTKDSTYEIINLQPNKSYHFYYEVVDSSNNIVKSQVYNIETEIDANSIELNDNILYMVKNESFTLNPKVDIDSNNYKIKYQSSDDNIATVSNTGVVNAINAGTCNITISVGKTKAILKVKVSTYQIIYLVSELPVAYVGKEYKMLIETNYPSKIILDNTTLSEGLSFINNTIVGTPKENSSGSYTIRFLSSYLDSESVREYSFSVKYDIEFNENKLSNGYLNKEYNQVISTNYPTIISLEEGTLPDGIILSNNKLYGTPTKEGIYNFTIKAIYMNSEATNDYTIVVKKHDIYFYIIIALIIIVVGVIIYILTNNKTTKRKIKY